MNENHIGMILGVTIGVVGGVLLGVFVHATFWAILPIGLCLGFVYDYSKKKENRK